MKTRSVFADVKPGALKTVQGAPLTIYTSGGVMVDQAKVVRTDCAGNNGVLHGIDRVLIPK